MTGRRSARHASFMSENVIDKSELPPETVSFADKAKAEASFFGKLITFLFLFFMLGWGQYKIPSESMQPTLEVGDHLFVGKFAYGYSRHSMPLGLHKLPIAKGKKIFSRLPKRGDVAVFRNPKNDLVMIKRVVGLPGDNIKVTGGRLFVNGEIIEREAKDSFLYRQHAKKGSRGTVVGVESYTEQFIGEKKPHTIYEQTDQGQLDNVGPFVVPDGHVFFMGDNRDNSVDSRAPLGPGFVPLDHLIGRADIMLFSFKRCADEEGLKCPGLRGFQPL